MNPFIGVLYHWLGGLFSASNFIPFRGIKRWSWEVYWIIQGVAAWLIAPSLVAIVFVPHVWSILQASPRSAIVYAAVWGACWGVGGLTFGLAIRYLGIALGYAIALGLCTAFGTLIPPIYSGEFTGLLHETAGRYILAGVVVCLVAVAVNGVAGMLKERELSRELMLEAGERDFSFWRGLAVAVFAGIMSAFFAYGLKAGAPIGAVARERLIASGRLELWQNLPVLIVVLWGGFASNLVWSLILLWRNRSFNQFAGAPGTNPMRAIAVSGDTMMDVDPRDLLHRRIALRPLLANYGFAALAGVVWYFQFFFYSLGQTKMGKYDFSSWTLHMASIIIFATLWGIALKEFHGTRLRTRLLVTLGLSLLVGSTLIVGYGNYLKAMSGS